MSPAAHTGGIAVLPIDRVQPDRQRAPAGSEPSQAVAVDTSRSPEARQLTSSTFIDPETKSVVFRVVSERWGAVVAQYPSDVQLQIRAYVARLDAGSEPREVKAI